MESMHKDMVLIYKKCRKISNNIKILVNFLQEK
jgi:hypothetical protein